MKYAHYDETTRQILGWYDNEIHKEIPIPNVEVEDTVWQNAINNNHNKVNEDGTTEKVDFRTQEEIKKEKELSYINAVQEYLDTTAQKTKWDNMQSARACAGIPLDGTETDMEVTMHADAVKLAKWYLKVWAYGYTQLDLINKGDRAVPASAEAFIAELPMLD